MPPPLGSLSHWAQALCGTVPFPPSCSPLPLSSPHTCPCSCCAAYSPRFCTLSGCACSNSTAKASYGNGRTRYDAPRPSSASPRPLVQHQGSFAQRRFPAYGRDVLGRRRRCITLFAAQIFLPLSFCYAPLARIELGALRPVSSGSCWCCPHRSGRNNGRNQAEIITKTASRRLQSAGRFLLSFFRSTGYRFIQPASEGFCRNACSFFTSSGWI